MTTGSYKESRSIIKLDIISFSIVCFRNGIPAIFQHPFCKVPPEDSNQAGDARTVEKENLGDSDNTAATKVKDSSAKEQVPSSQTHQASSDRQVDNVSTESTASITPEAVQATKKPFTPQEEKRTKKEETQKKLRDLLTSLASVRMSATLPYCQCVDYSLLGIVAQGHRFTVFYRVYLYS